MAAAGGLFHNLGSSLPSDLSTYIWWGVLNSHVSMRTRIIQERKLAVVSYIKYLFHRTVLRCEGRSGGGYWYLLRMVKRVGPTSVAQEREHRFYLLRFSGCEGKNGKDIETFAEDKLTSQGSY